MGTTVLRLGCAAALLLVIGCRAHVPPPPDDSGARLTHGVAVGEVKQNAAVVWGRCDRATTLHARTSDGAGGSVEVEAERDFTGRIALEGLAANRSIEYVVWCGPESEPGAAAARSQTGRFLTAPAADDAATPVRFAWGGDVGGQNVCRDAAEGYFIFDRLLARDLSFFIALGDMIYADDSCLADGRYGNRQIPGPPPSTAEAASFHAHWRYNREDEAFRHFLAGTSYYAVWDDHEIVNDADPEHDRSDWEPAKPRLPPARAAFCDYQPLPDGERLYRRFRWGAHLEIFLLDNRSYRDANNLDDTAERPKTMLGAAQRDWLVDGVSQSTATWKVVISSVPISIPVGGPNRGMDSWANADTSKGFEHELLAILSAWQRAGVDNVVFLTTDVHFATGFRYPAPGGFGLLELVSGPLNAGMFPKFDYDATLQPERLFFYGPSDPLHLRFPEARPYFNFGELEVNAGGELTARIVNGDGDVVWENRFVPGSRFQVPGSRF